MNEFSALPSIVPGEYEHYKGKRYRVLGVGQHTESDDYFVVYTPLYEHAGQPDIWLRPYDMFVGIVEVDGKIIERFKRLEAI